jgi:hypothetical protein
MTAAVAQSALNRLLLDSVSGCGFPLFHTLKLQMTFTGSFSGEFPGHFFPLFLIFMVGAAKLSMSPYENFAGTQ